MEMKSIRITRCRDCPNVRTYDPNEEGETLGCSYKYGSLPQEGFPSGAHFQTLRRPNNET